MIIAGIAKLSSLWWMGDEGGSGTGEGRSGTEEGRSGTEEGRSGNTAGRVVDAPTLTGGK